jgi:hypothetical protein
VLHDFREAEEDVEDRQVLLGRDGLPSATLGIDDEVPARFERRA